MAHDTGDNLRRFGIFKDTVRRVYTGHPGHKHYVLGLNGYTDMRTEEVRAAFAYERHADGGVSDPGQRDCS